ncbi:hypothetical protein [Bacillus sp. AFS040349]|uniref:hypothetical protein n=1 Tax=Bacillus sp. AFS040349 TaxID=2033502 RepID=UPI000BFDAFB2|nr:hypothetical protein [Bacillus sp. AFS040349]PGT80556.1 hypothetical protein COD11_20820 [Bacillus sp. AFS040349]
MFYKNLNVFGIITFEPDHYKKINKLVKESRAYVSYIDSKKDTGTINRRYENYVVLKQAAYTYNAPQRNKDPNMNKIFSTIMPKSVTQEQINTFLKEHGMNQDYEYDYSIVHKDEGSYVATHNVIPIEHSVFNTVLDLDDNFEKINRKYLNEEFLFKNYQRFTLLPFLAKYKDNYVKPIVIANVYDIGIITIQISIGFNNGHKVEIPNEEPNSIILDDLEFYRIKKNYSSRDFWIRDKIGKGTMYDILNYYTKQLKAICESYELNKHSEKQIAWVFGDFAPNKRSEHEDFVSQNKKLFISHLINAPKQFVERMTDDDISQLLDDSRIQKLKSMHFYCSEVISLLSFSYSAFHEDAVHNLQDAEKDLKRQGVYNDMLIEEYKESSLFSMYEFLRIYELTFIKRFYAKKLLNKMSNNMIKSLKEYNSIRHEFNSLKVNYDEQLLFKSYGSPMILYGKLLEKSGTDRLVDKVEKLFTNAREDVNSSREFAIKQSETYILIMTSLLTILLGYRGIKFIVDDILVNLPGVGTYFAMHPLRWTISFWIILFISMITLNVLRIKAIRS